MTTGRVRYRRAGSCDGQHRAPAEHHSDPILEPEGSGGTLLLTFLGSMLNFFLPMATCLFLCMFFL